MVFCSGYLPLFIGVVPFDFPVIKEAANVHKILLASRRVGRNVGLSLWESIRFPHSKLRIPVF